MRPRGRGAKRGDREGEERSSETEFTRRTSEAVKTERERSEAVRPRLRGEQAKLRRLERRGAKRLDREGEERSGETLIMGECAKLRRL